MNASAKVRDAAARIVILVRERDGRFAIRGDAGREREAHRRAWDQPDALAEAHDRIERDAGRARQRAAVERRRTVGVAAAAEESRAVGLPFDRPLRPAFEAQARAPPICRTRAESRGRRWQTSAALSGRYSVSTKQLAERRMREIVGWRRQDDLGVAGDVDFADPRALIHDRHPADFDVVFGGDRDRRAA